MSPRRFVAVCLLVLCFTASHAADQPIRVAAPVPPAPYLAADNAAIAATQDGFAVVWRDWGTSPEVLRFQRFGPDGAPLSTSRAIDFDLGLLINFYGQQLVPSGSGFVTFLGNDGISVYSVPLAADGSRTGSPREVVTSDEMYPFSVASSGGRMVLTYPEWNGTWVGWSVEVGQDGRAKAPRANVAPVPPSGSLLGAFLLDLPIAPVPSGFLAAWDRHDFGVFLRQLDGRGRPAGDVVQVAPPTDCIQAAGVAGMGDEQAIVYTFGCDPASLRARIRDRKGALSEEIVLDDDPVHDPIGSSSFIRRLRVTGGAPGFVALWVVRLPNPDGSFSFDWALARFDRAGRRVGPRQLLRRDLQADMFTDPDLVWDAARNRGLVTWAGDGPDGPGLYVMPVTIAP